MDGKRMLSGRAFWLAVGLAALSILCSAPYPDWEKTPVLEAGTFLTLAESGMRGRAVLYLLPIVSALPYGDAYLQERQQGFLRQLLIRRSRRDYLRDKWIITPFGGMLAWVLAVLLAVLLYFLLFFPQERPGRIPGSAVADLTKTLLRLCLLSGTLANVSACASLLFRSYSMAFGLPFFLFYLPGMLYERYFQKLYVLDPIHWLSMKGDWGRGHLGLWMFLLLLFAGSAVLYGLALQERIREVE